MSRARSILHVDMDAFFAAIEQHDDPSLRGRPVLVGSPERRGVVAAASYEARAHGCHSAQPMTTALRRCPSAVVVRPRRGRYVEVSRGVFAVLEDLVPVVEPLGIDEAFLDVTGTEAVLGSPQEVARRIKEAIRAAVGLTASVGVAPNKFLAKIASDLEKPDGLTVIPPEGVDEVLLPLPVERIPGIGEATARRLRAEGIRTVADLRAWGAARLGARFGAQGEAWHRLARGIDDRPVRPRGEAKSVSHERTFPHDLEDVEEACAVLRRLTEDVGRRLRAEGQEARTVTVKIRFGDFQTLTRSETLDAPTDVTQEMWQAVSRLFARWARRAFVPVRLLGVAATHLGRGAGQLPLFPDAEHERRRRLDGALDEIRRRFGRDAVRRRPGPGP